MGNFIGSYGTSLSNYFDPKRANKCDREKQCPVVTVSRSVGAGGSKIAELLSEELTVPCFGYSLIDGIVKESKQDKFLLSLVDEKAPGVLEDWIHSLFTQGGISKSGFYMRLIKTTLAIAKTGGVIVGRGAHLVLANNPRVFRLRIEGSLDCCIERVVEREKIKKKKARELIFNTERQRRKYVRELYNRFPHDRAYYDLVINTDKLTPHDAVEIVTYSMEKMGYYVPGEDVIKQQNL
ncbi:MAG: cytidylate kinase-like family protein [Magnetococcales bacterium]|nr:cytidylate kinase-like family protein [Magnetococcales bacterium]